jgi:hypothetical protein
MRDWLNRFDPAQPPIWPSVIGATWRGTDADLGAEAALGAFVVILDGLADGIFSKPKIAAMAAVLGGQALNRNLDARGMYHRRTVFLRERRDDPHE